MDEGNKGDKRAGARRSGGPIRSVGHLVVPWADRRWSAVAVTVALPSETNSEWASDAIVVESARHGIRFRCNVHIPEVGRGGRWPRMASKRNGHVG